MINAYHQVSCNFYISPLVQFAFSIFINFGVIRSSPRKPDAVITTVVVLIRLQVYNWSAKTTDTRITISKANSIAVFLGNFEKLDLLLDFQGMRENM